MRRESIDNMRGGQGCVKITHITDDENDLNNKGRMLAIMTLPPGSSIGHHKHVGETETYYVLSGQGVVNDNGREVVVKPGDMVHTGNGESHSVRNTSNSTNLEILALILFV